MTCLLDANILIALADSNHVHHQRTQTWFHSRPATDGWATCPLTENAFLRILGNPNYPASPGDPATLRPFLNESVPGRAINFGRKQYPCEMQKCFRNYPGSKS